MEGKGYAKILFTIFATFLKAKIKVLKKITVKKYKQPRAIKKSGKYYHNPPLWSQSLWAYPHYWTGFEPFVARNIIFHLGVVQIKQLSQ